MDELLTRVHQVAVLCWFSLCSGSVLICHDRYHLLLVGSHHQPMQCVDQSPPLLDYSLVPLVPMYQQGKLSYLRTLVLPD